MLSSSRIALKSVLQSSFCKCRLHNKQLVNSGKWRKSVRLYSSESTEPLPKPNQAEEKHYPPKLQQIVADISQLNLIEVADLNELLKKTLKIQDAPVMAMGAAAAGPAPQAEEEEEEAQAVTKSTFNVKLTGFNAEKKIALIKEIKSLIPDTNLVQAKKFVESVPVHVKTDLTKEEAEELVKSLTNAGGQADIE